MYKRQNENTLKNAYAEDGALPKTAVEVNALKKTVESDNLGKSEHLGKLKTVIEDDDRKQDELKSKINALNRAGKVNAQWKTLDTLFGGTDGFTFKKIAQSYIMQDILNHANAYLRKIAPRYELTAQPGSLVILVEDNEDGVVRSGNTLSGGEGFVISLSLAAMILSLTSDADAMLLLRLFISTVTLSYSFRVSLYFLALSLRFAMKPCLLYTSPSPRDCS